MQPHNLTVYGRWLGGALILSLSFSLVASPSIAFGARTIFFEDFESDVPDTLPASVDLYARSLVVPPPDPSGAFTTGGMFPDPFGPGNQSMVMHNPNAAAQFTVNFYEFFDEDPTQFRNGVIEFDVYMEAAEPDSYWTFLDMRYGFDTDGVRTVSTQNDVTIWNTLRMQEGGLQASGAAPDILYDYRTTSSYANQDVVVPERKMHIRYEINGTSATYVVRIDNLEDPDAPVEVSWPGANPKPWYEIFNFETFMFEPTPGINVIAFLTDASAHGLSQKSQNTYIDNLRVINNDLEPLTGADFDEDDDVDGADFLTWQRNNPTAGGASLAMGDATGEGDVNGADLAVWKTQFGPVIATGAAGAVPEPGPAALAVLACVALSCIQRRVGQRNAREHF